ncbi:MAG: DUF2789 domain-containing protein [Gammaproteobacteria bacterium]|nr:DUF2789 domain-containing protein [Gammaproteobacteria bacterium]
MDTSNHNQMATLFAQLGLASDSADITKFLQQHRLTDNQRIEQADYWTPAQAAFLQEAIAQDSDWAELVDHLDAMLRH